MPIELPPPAEPQYSYLQAWLYLTSCSVHCSRRQNMTDARAGFMPHCCFQAEHQEVSPYLKAYIKHRASRASLGPGGARKSRISIANLLALIPTASRTSGVARRSTHKKKGGQDKGSTHAAGLENMVRHRVQSIVHC